jgi:hypothetical protein
MTNPLLEPAALPAIAGLRPEHVEDAVTRH